MKVNSKVASNALTLFMEWFSSTLFSLIYVIIMGKILPTQDFGIVQTCLSAIGIVFLFTTWGLDIAMSKLIPEYEKDREKTNSLIQYSTKFVLIMNLVVLASILIFSKNLASLINLPLDAIWLMSICILAFSIFTLSGEIIYGFQNMKKKFATAFAGNLIKVIVSSVLILMGMGYMGPLVGFAIGFGLLGILRFDKSWFKKVKYKLNKKWVLNEYAFPAFIGVLTTNIFITSQNIILNSLKGPEVTGIFSMGLTLIIPIWVIPQILSKALFPISSQLCMDKNKKKKQGYLMNLMIRYAFLLVLPVSIFLSVFSERMVILMSQPSYLPATKFFPILALGGLFYGFAMLFNSNLYATRKPKINRNISIATSILFFLIVFPLANSFSGTGMAISYAISTLFMLILSFYFLKKHLKLEAPFKDLEKIIFASVLFFLVLWIAHKSITSPLIKFGVALISGGFYILILVPLRFYKKDDVEIIQSFGQTLPKFLRKYVDWLCDILLKFSKNN